MAEAKTDPVAVVSDPPHQGRYKLLKQEVEIYLSVDHPNIARLQLASKWQTERKDQLLYRKSEIALDVCPWTVVGKAPRFTKVHRCIFENE